MTVTYKGKSYPSIAELARQVAVVPANIVRQRVSKQGWTLHKALTTPIAKSRKWVVGGKEFETLRDAVNAYGGEGVSSKIADTRIRLGWSVSKAVKTPVTNRPVRRSITVDGKKFDSITAAAEAYGISKGTAAKRARKGWSDHEIIFGRKKKKPKPLEHYRPKKKKKPRNPTEFRGKMYDSFADLARKHGVDPRTAQGRLRYGWTLEEALGLVEHKDKRADILRKYSSGKKAKQSRKKHKIVVDGIEYPTLTAAATAFGLPRHTFVSRLRYGYTPEEAAGLKKTNRRKRKALTTVVVRGKEFRSLAAAAAHFDVPIDTVNYRLHRAASFEEALGLKPFRSELEVEFRGQRFATQLEMCEHYDVHYLLYHERKKKGWTVAEALGLEEHQSETVKGGYNASFFEGFPEAKFVDAWLYFIRVTCSESNETFHKVGITSRSIKGRFATQPGYSVESLCKIELPLFVAWQEEQSLLEDYSANRFTWRDVNFSGRTECLNLSKSEVNQVKERLLAIEKNPP